MDYEVKAVKGREIVLLTIDAANAQAAMAQAKAQGLMAISARATSVVGGLKRRVVFPLVLFSQELLALLDAGLNLVEAIEGLAEKEIRPQVKSILDAVLQALYEGQTFSAALTQYPTAFPSLYVATVRASEKTGDLPEALGRYVAYEQQLGLVKKKVVTASIYPLLLIGVGGLVIMFLMGFVVPKFSRIYEGTGGNLPFLSQMLLAWGLFLESHGREVLLGVIATIAIVIYAFSQSSVRQSIVQLFWRIPALGERLRIFQLARFYRTLGMLLSGGTPIVSALDSVAGLLQVSLRNRMEQASLMIRQGQPISAAMEAAALTTPVALRMLRVGERSGKIGDMMERVAAFYDEEFARWIDWFTRLFEPILMMVIGVVIGVVVLLLYMPIFELAGNIQ